MTIVLQAWKLEALKLFIRISVAYEDGDETQQQDLGRTMRPTMTRIKGLMEQAATDSQAQVDLLDAVDDAHLLINKVMGTGWQPHGALATKLRGHSIDTARLLD